jgi:hypothetical protein
LLITCTLLIPRSKQPSLVSQCTTHGRTCMCGRLRPVYIVHRRASQAAVRLAARSFLRSSHAYMLVGMMMPSSPDWSDAFHGTRFAALIPFWLWAHSAALSFLVALSYPTSPPARAPPGGRSWRPSSLRSSRPRPTSVANLTSSLRSSWLHPTSLVHLGLCGILYVGLLHLFLPRPPPHTSRGQARRQARRQAPRPPPGRSLPSPGRGPRYAPPQASPWLRQGPPRKL